MRHTTGAMKAAGSTASRRPSTHPRATILVTMKFSDRRSHVTRVVGLPNPCAFPSPLLPQEVSRSIPRPFRGPACPPMNIFAVCVCGCAYTHAGIRAGADLLFWTLFLLPLACGQVISVHALCIQISRVGGLYHDQSEISSRSALTQLHSK